jgi:hypothetical protein
VIQAGETSEKHTHPPHGVLELSWSSPAGFSRNVLRVIGTDGYMTITSVTKSPSEGDQRLAKAAPFAKTGANGEQVAMHIRVAVHSGSDGSQVEESDTISSGVVAEIEGFVKAIAGQDDGKGEPR